MSILIIFSIFIFSLCSYIVADENKNNVKEVDEIINKDTMLKNDSSSKSINAADEKEIDDTFPDKWYTKVKSYSIAPTELTNIDMARPDDNSEWIKSLIIKYPQIYNLKDIEKEKRINDMIYKEVLYYHDILDNRDYIDYSADYKIMEANEKNISILFTGEINDQKEANRFAHAITIDVDSEKKLELQDFYHIDESFVNDYLFVKFEIVENNFEDISENIPFIESYIELYSQIPHAKDFYIVGDNIGIIVPTHNSMGYILLQGKMGK
ncbi:hypothetical protein SH1V18_18360 [Vallitalea longa]|uniref:Uncharacterized protein n=1 Tax=Vallitalea longa TaxID=2936439 RepID=A0A9W6DDT5_9FIRM|nr:hypothetical protein [Vallitalea longa]GKX29356.1 hypothetical protein SH1V18_18360 [Vallitalea longa]